MLLRFPIFTEPWSPALYDEKGVRWNDAPESTTHVDSSPTRFKSIFVKNLAPLIRSKRLEIRGRAYLFLIVTLFKPR